jgi:hypothetical protein
MTIKNSLNMKNLIFKTSAILLLFVLTSYSLPDDIIKTKKLIGTWEYSAPEAPYQYQKGEIIFEEKEGVLTGYFLIEGFKAQLRNLNSQKSKVTCEAYIQGITVSFDLTFKKKSFLGTASYSEGTLDISGHKKRD